jgi:hypothetical protein
MAVCSTYFATEAFGVDYHLETLGVTISYPIASFALKAGCLENEAIGKHLETERGKSRTT